MEIRSSVSILGCGYLGLPLAKRFVEEGFKVKGSTTTLEKTFLLSKDNITPFLIRLNFDGIKGDIGEFLKSKILIIDIPFKRSFEDPLEYKQQMEQLIPFIENSSVSHVVFTSSTSVYPAAGNFAKEDEEIISDNRRSQVLLETENLLKKNKYFNTTILRLAGLYGESREILGFLKNERILDWPKSPMNLIHQDDCVEIIVQIILQGIENEIFNVCADSHPLREELYSSLALKEGLPAPVFRKALRPGPVKIVSNEKLKQRLNFKFKYETV